MRSHATTRREFFDVVIFPIELVEERIIEEKTSYEIKVIVKPVGGCDNDMFEVVAKIETHASHNNAKRPERKKVQQVTLFVYGETQCDRLRHRSSAATVEVEFNTETCTGRLEATTRK